MVGGGYGASRHAHSEIRGGDHYRKLIHQEILLVTRRYLTVIYLMVTKRYK